MTTTHPSDVFDTDDLTAPAVNLDPWSYYGRLRETDPVHWNELFKTWIVTRHDDVLHVTRRNEVFSSKVPLPYRDVTEEYPPIDEADWPLAERHATWRAFIFNDRPAHQAQRERLHRWFTPRSVEKWRAQLAERAQSLVDARLDDGGMEVKDDLAKPLPLLTICWMLGVPSEDAGELYDLASVCLPGGTENLNYGAARLRVGYEAGVKLREYFTPLLEQRARDPKGDLISMIAGGERDGVFTRDESLASIMILLDAGHTTTLSMVSKGVLAFIRHPGQWDLLRTDPDALAPSATEECLRWDPPIKNVILRFAITDTELRGRQIRAGQTVSYVPASANRDPRVFADPETFDITRAPNPHVAFGGGIHHCIGASLARLEGQEAFKALARRVPRLRLEREPEYLVNPVLHMVTELRVRWD